MQIWQQRISQRQPQSQTNRYQVLSCQWNYTIISRSFSRLNDWTLVSVEITLIFQYSCLSHLEHSFLLLLWDLSFVKRAVYFCLVFYNPFFFPGNFAENCCMEANFFNPLSDPYLAKKIGQNFLKCCKSNTTLRFVSYAKIKLT